MMSKKKKKYFPLLIIVSIFIKISDQKFLITVKKTPKNV